MHWIHGDGLPWGTHSLLAGGKPQFNYPLRVKEYKQVACDLEASVASKKLLEAGFDPTQPTVWLMN